MKVLLPVVIAGGTFTAAALLGLLGGVIAAGRTGEPLLVPGGLMLGAALGGFSGLALLMRSLR